MTDSDVYTAIAHPFRRQILDMLIGQDHSVHMLAKAFAVSRPAISQHLAILRDAGLVSARRDGRQQIYHLEAGALQQVQQWVAQYERFWQRKLDALESYLQRQSRAANSDEP